MCFEIVNPVNATSGNSIHARQQADRSPDAADSMVDQETKTPYATSEGTNLAKELHKAHQKIDHFVQEVSRLQSQVRQMNQIVGELNKANHTMDTALSKALVAARTAEDFVIQITKRIAITG